MTARDDLEKLEASTDWAYLIERALADPPEPDELAFQFNRWGALFQICYGGQALRPDFPPGMDAFLQTLAFAGISPALVEWADSFQRKHKRRPNKNEIPNNLRSLLPSKKGRPRCDTQRMRKAARAWEAEIYRQSYQARREGIEIGKLAGFTSCYGFDQVTIQDDRPSALALEKLSDETGKSESFLLDIIFPRRNK